MTALFIRSLIETAPTWFPVVLVIIGFAVNTLSAVTHSHRSLFGPRPDQNLLAAIFFGIGATIAVQEELRNNPTIFILVLISIGRWFEGVSSVRLYLKVVRFLHPSSSSDPSTNPVARFIKTRLFKLFLVFLVYIAVLIVGGILLYGSYNFSNQYTIRLIVTAYLLGISVLSYFWKLRHTLEVLPTGYIFGTTLMIVGAELYNLKFTLDLFTYVIGGIVYTAGFWTAVALWISART